MGLLLSFVALFCWGFGDFFIQKTTRAIGSWRALFFIGLFGSVALFPFIRHDFFALTTAELTLLVLLCVVVMFATIFDFEAMRRGKIAVVEPVISMEMPMAVALSVALGREQFNLPVVLLVGVVFFGISLSVVKHHSHLLVHRRLLEKGVLLAGVAAIGMALMNFLVGVSSQNISPLMTIWFVHTVIALICLIYVFFTGKIRDFWQDIKKHPAIIVAQSTLDTFAWIAYAIATTLIPISIAVTISESYVAVAVLLGIIVNREKLRWHQIFGITIAISGVIFLSILVG